MSERTPDDGLHAQKSAYRIENIDKSFWAELTNLGRQYNAINIGQGFPDCLPPEHLRKALIEVAHSDDHTLHQYARSFGHPRLVKIMSTIYSQVLGREIDPMSNVLITAGASNALFDCAHAFINPGDEAIIIEPCFDVCESQIRMAGGRPVFVPMRLERKENPNDVLNSSKSWKLDFEELESKFNVKTKLLYLTNPHNPTGKVFSREELMKIANLAEKFNVIVVADEVYEWIVFDNVEMVKFSTLPEMWKRTLSIGSVGKTFSVTGWKMGWIVGPSDLMKSVYTVHHNVMYMCPTPLQEAVAIGFEKEYPLLNTAESYFSRLGNELQTNRDRMSKLVAKMGLIPIIPDGAYFMMADFSALNKELKFESNCTVSKDFEFVKWLCKEKKILGTPPTPFYCNEHRSLGENMKNSTFEAAEKLVGIWKNEKIL